MISIILQGVLYNHLRTTSRRVVGKNRKSLCLLNTNLDTSRETLEIEDDPSLLKESENKFSLNWELLCEIFCNSSRLKKEYLRFQETFYCTLTIPVINRSDMFLDLKITSEMSVLSNYPKEELETYDILKNKCQSQVKDENDSLLELKCVDNSIVKMPSYFHHTEQNEFQVSKKIDFSSELAKPKECLSCLLSQINNLLLVEEFRLRVIREAGIGLPTSDWPALELRQMNSQSSQSNGNSGSVNVKADSENSNDKQPDLLRHPGPNPGFILKALTSKHHGDQLDHERLKIIGHSFLEYAITMHLFCTYPEENEGMLTQWKVLMLSKATLFKLGKGKNIPSNKMVPSLNGLSLGCKQRPCLQEVVLESGLLITPEWIKTNMPLSIWDINLDDIQEFVKKLDANSKLNGLYNSHLSGDSSPLNNVSSLNSIGNNSLVNCVEALIGVYTISTGILGGLCFINWLGLNVLQTNKMPKDLKDCFTLPPQLINNLPYVKALKTRYLIDLEKLEESINYKFQNKMYLLEAIWHPSCNAKPITRCYQRLEFLGDAVLNFLITCYLYDDPKCFSTGNLNDLRMALINNDYFAKLAVKRGLHQHLKYFSPSLLKAITEFANKFKNGDMDFFQEINLNETCDGAAEDLESPKVLSDIMEAIAGAIYLDSELSLQKVWDVFYNMMANDINVFRNCIPINPVKLLFEQFPGQVTCLSPERTRAGIKTKVRLCVKTENKEYIFIGVAVNKKMAKLIAAKLANKRFSKFREACSFDAS